MVERGKKNSLDNNRRGQVIALCAYCMILVFIPLVLRRHNTFILFHAKQGFVLFIVECCVGIIRFMPVIGEVLFVFGMVICGIFSLIGIFKVCMNETWEMPVIFDIAEKLPWK